MPHSKNRSKASEHLVGLHQVFSSGKVIESVTRRASPMKKTAALVLTILACATSASAQKLAVKILDRQDNDTDYAYVVPAHWFSNSNTNVNCGGSDTNVNCNGSTNATGTVTPAHQVSYHLRGATFTLQLPDGPCEESAPRHDHTGDLRTLSRNCSKHPVARLGSVCPRAV